MSLVFCSSDLVPFCRRARLYEARIAQARGNAWIVSIVSEAAYRPCETDNPSGFGTLCIQWGLTAEHWGARSLTLSLRQDEIDAIRDARKVQGPTAERVCSGANLRSFALSHIAMIFQLAAEKNTAEPHQPVAHLRRMNRLDKAHGYPSQAHDLAASRVCV
jgi:hypothetical protein